MISINVTNTTVYAVCGKYAGGRVAVQAMAEKPLFGYVKSDGTSDVKGFADDLRQVLAGFRENTVTIQFSESTVVSSQYEFPYEKKPVAMLNIVRSGITQNTQDHIMDYAVLDIYKKDGGEFSTVQVYLTPRTLVEFAGEAIRMAGKKPYRFQVAENCLYNLQNTGDGFGASNVIVASIGSARVSVTLLTTLEKVLTRTAPVLREAEAYNQAAQGLYDPSAAMQAATEQISKMIQYQSIKEPGHPVDQIYLFGKYVSPQDVRDMGDSLGAPVSLLRQPDYRGVSV